MHDVQEFSWDLHAYDLFWRFLPELADSLHKQISYAFNMTNNSYGSKNNNIDTSKFRNAIFYYVTMIHGLRDD